MAKGVDAVFVYCVNDGAVMKAWGKAQGVPEGSPFLTLLADTRCELTKALGVVMDHKGPMEVLGGLRCKRFAMLVEDGTVKALEISEGPGDPAGDEDPSASLAENFMAKYL
eukprot:gnl/MRDRNA2_/MRDRNA2_18567_c0_seq1.p1 gnl/MRDRNA2_/MRDRNA2_18567_c0~~gnl/MRDRNA2_/MRDRNA2_18567_c0_seq1.p1  ORF type:complete len:111 (-),score=29.15 gnl/MRDRNA2_/MRDRNA2_18567_c0_seq1:156-488(-)